MARSLSTPAEFQTRVIPELLRRWDRNCFCRNGNFLKLIAFDFRDYDVAPVKLADSELVITGLIFERCEAMGDWTPAGRTHRCPQCGTRFQSQYEQFSIAMDCLTTRTVEALPMAAMGQYLVGYQYFAGEQDSIARIKDFKLAESVDQFIDDICAPPPTA